MVIKYEELRRIKDSLPDGSMQKIATDLGIDVETVRNYFGGYNYRKGLPTDVHFEKGMNGGVVRIDDAKILDYARKMVNSQQRVSLS